ncbi:MAG TPA: DNA-processing protein DprA [Thermoleophilaceae bacterium]|nr:DNA-processing protein DprA [Thermoleophilaceae bacterium]
MGHLAPRLAALLGESPTPGKRRGRLLALPDAELIEATCCAERRAEAHSLLETFDPARAREALLTVEVEAVCRHALTYPSGLSDLDDAPAVLFVAGGAGRLKALTGAPAVTVVGTRRPSPYGLEVARVLGRGLSAAGVTVVSGLALGIDASAHRGALEGGGAVVAVLARGPDAAYPRSHQRLYERVRTEGCVVSEFPPGVPVHRWAFPARNRIMAALGSVTVVVEADDPSGSLITCRFAEDLGRTVAAVPGRITTGAARGTNRLLRDGARVVLGPEDLLEELFGPGAAPVAPVPDPPVLESPLAEVLAAIEGSAGVSAIAARTGLAPGAVRAALGRLEVMGLVRRDGLGFERTAAPAYAARS